MPRTFPSPNDIAALLPALVHGLRLDRLDEQVLPLAQAVTPHFEPGKPRTAIGVCVYDGHHAPLMPVIFAGDSMQLRTINVEYSRLH